MRVTLIIDSKRHGRIFKQECEHAWVATGLLQEQLQNIYSGILENDDGFQITIEPAKQYHSAIYRTSPPPTGGDALLE